MVKGFRVSGEDVAWMGVLNLVDPKVAEVVQAMKKGSRAEP